MGRIYPLHLQPASGDTFTPRALITEARSIHGEFNGRLDSDNLAGNLITDTKFELDALVEFVSDSASNTYVFTANGYTAPVGKIPVLDSSGAPMVVDVTTTDCPIIIEAMVTANVFALGLRIEVDGLVVAQSAPQPTSGVTHRLKACEYVGAGTHRVALFFTRAASAAATVSGFVKARSLSVRVAKR